ncbi:MAG TPA: AAA family ATPase [bacterium]|nr:AAA family ATPase [bacterium]HQO35653.1 AAA family ATPase [bacterium]HQP97380.1 AAA family ATPase [bacterium]
MSTPFRIKSIEIKGFRPFREFAAGFGPLEVLVGSNGSGKSSLFEFFKFLREGMYREIPPEVVAGSIGQQVFHTPGLDRFSWELVIDTERPVSYRGELTGPIGRISLTYERVESRRSSDGESYLPMHIQWGKGPAEHLSGQRKIDLKRTNQLALSVMTDSGYDALYTLREFIRGWRFYSSFNIANHLIRKSVVIEQEPVLHEDARNLSSLLHYLMTEHPSAYDELQHHLRLAVPGFKELTVKARGGPGEVIAFWREEGVGNDLSLADLSDGILRLICWMALCVQPNPPSLICIDEPDQGVHPRTLPILAGLFEKASERTQIILATHASYFLTQFDISRIAVMRKEDGQAVFIKPKDSAVLVENLKEFGAEEIEAMHQNDELERLA